MNPGDLSRRVASVLGSRIVDANTGEVLGKAIVLPWRGRIHLIGLTCSVPLRPVAVSSQRLSYWRTSLGFAAPREPDFPNIR